MLDTSILESFKHNVRQVSPAIITLARTAKKFQENIKSFLNVLDDPTADEESLGSLGKFCAHVQTNVGSVKVKVQSSAFMNACSAINDI